MQRHDVLSKVLKIDLELGFNLLNDSLHEKIEKFEPTGVGNPTPLFVTKKVEVVDARVVGKNGNHLKMKLEQNGNVIDAIAFGFGDAYPGLSPDVLVDVVYNLDMNVWNDIANLQLKIRDIRECSN